MLLLGTVPYLVESRLAAPSRRIREPSGSEDSKSTAMTTQTAPGKASYSEVAAAPPHTAYAILLALCILTSCHSIFRVLACST